MCNKCTQDICWCDQITVEVGDMVKVVQFIDDETDNPHLVGCVGKVVKILYNEPAPITVQFNDIRESFWPEELEKI